jgi:site-specific DNA-methyltransferase (adenine-specific)
MVDMKDLINKIHLGDCLDVMKQMPDKSIDCIICDLPYGTTACKWDTVIPFDKLWEQYNRIIKDNGAIILTASQPFTSILVMSNLKMFKYEWIWQKAVGSNFATLKYQPMKEHESVLVFSKNRHNYYPIMEERKGNGAERCKYGHSGGDTGEVSGKIKFAGFTSSTYNPELRNPSSIQYFNNRESCRGLHPTQKPVALIEYLIKTYTKENEIILDNCSGSGTLAIAATRTNRNFICIEKDPEYHRLSVERLEKEQNNLFNV